MELNAWQRANVLVLAPAGRVDHRTAGEFEQALAPHMEGCTADGNTVVLDLGGVDYMSSVGLRVLMLVSKQARRQQGKVAIAALQPTLAEIFAISRFDRVFDVHTSVEEALGVLSPEALVEYRRER